MNLRTSAVILAAALCEATACAALIPYYRMDSLAIQSEAIVLAAELEIGQQTTRTNEWGHPYQGRETRFRVTETLKGSLTNGQDIAVFINSIYTRCYEADALSTNAPSAIPLGHAVLFLERRSGALQPVLVGIKLVIGNQTYCYGQFVTNPGPLWLALQQPENLDLPDTEPYTEAMLLKDLRLALVKAKLLSKPQVSSADQAKRKTRPNTASHGTGCALP